MKNAKKVLGLVIAVVMLINVFAVCSFAGSTAAVSLILTCDKSYYSAGDTVTFTVSADYAADVGDVFAGNQTAIAYNSAVIAPMSDSDDAVTTHGMVGLLGGYDSSLSGVDFTAGGVAVMDNEYAWDSVISYNYADDASTATTPSGTTGICQFQMKLASNVADGSYVVGFNEDSYNDDNCAAYVNDAVNVGIYGQTAMFSEDVNYAFTNCTVTVGEPAVSAVENGVQGQYADDTKTIWNLGVKGQINAVTDFGFDANGKSANVTAVGAIVTIGGVSQEKEVRFVYLVGGSYQYRVVIEDIAADATGTATIQFYYKALGSDAKILGETVTVDFATAHTNFVNAYNAANA